MAAMDFPPNTAHPAAPIAGEKYPVPPVPNKPVYVFDGVKWTTLGDEADDIIGASVTTPKMDATPAVVGVEANWSRGDHVHPTDTTRAPVDSPTFTTLAKAPTPVPASNDTNVATTAFVSAAIFASPAGSGAPVDALAFGGMQINGGFEVSQSFVAGSIPIFTSGQYICDGWKLISTGTVLVNGSTGLSSTSVLNGFPSALSVTVTTAQPTLSGSDALYVQQPIEGTRVSRLSLGRLNAMSFTVSFWSWHARIGLYSGSVTNASGTRSYVFTYTQATTGVMQYNTFVIPGDTGGAWATDTTIGLMLNLTMAAGPTLTTSSVNTWIAGNFVAGTGQVNAVAATTDVLRITGVSVMPGAVSIPASRSSLIARTYGEELRICKRYWERVPFYMSGYASGVMDVSRSELLSEEKRTQTPNYKLQSAGGNNWTPVSAGGKSTWVVYNGQSIGTGPFIMDGGVEVDARM